MVNGVGVVAAEVTTDPIDLAGLAQRVDCAAAGAVVTFSGVVRNHDAGRSVTRLRYEGHPSAGDVMAQVAADVLAAAAAEGGSVHAVAVQHRLGDLRIGDVALGVAVAASHRGQAFHTAAVMVDEVKARIPVWKHQFFADGTDEWVAFA